MKKTPILISIISLFCIGTASFFAASMTDDSLLKPSVAAGDYYSITINAEDVTTSETPVSDSFIAHTDQQNNPITFNFENISFEQEDDNKYLVFSEDAFFGNDRNSQIRQIEVITVYGNGGAFTYDYGWSTKSGSIVYTGKDFAGSANGVDISLGTNWPNYFTIMHRDGAADAKISKIVFKYKRDCTPGIQPTLSSITLSGQTTSLTRGAAFSFGGTVTANYANGTTANVTSLTTFSGYNMATSATYTVTASYTEGGITQTATYSLTVKPKWQQLWSGTKDIYVSLKTDGGMDAKTSGMGTIVSKAVHSSKQLRVTYSATYSTDAQWPTDVSSWVCGIYWGNASRATSYGSSPKTVTISSWGSTILNVRSTSSDTGSGSGYWAGFKIATDSSGNITASVTHTPTYGRIKIGIKITKIEEYY